MPSQSRGACGAMAARSANVACVRHLDAVERESEGADERFLAHAVRDRARALRRHVDGGVEVRVVDGGRARAGGDHVVCGTRRATHTRTRGPCHTGRVCAGRECAKQRGCAGQAVPSAVPRGVCSGRGILPGVDCQECTSAPRRRGPAAQRTCRGHELQRGGRALAAMHDRERHVRRVGGDVDRRVERAVELRGVLVAHRDAEPVRVRLHTLEAWAAEGEVRRGKVGADESIGAGWVCGVARGRLGMKQRGRAGVEVRRAAVSGMRGRCIEAGWVRAACAGKRTGGR
eukprot:4232620-Prymnesium_polylepis.1